MKNFKYYFLWTFVWPFALLEWFIFFECPYRTWDQDIWLYRVLIWHDNFYAYSENE